MSDLSILPPLSPTEARSIDQTCDRFEAAWKAGQRPHPEAYLGAVGEPARSALLRQLLLLDWDYRQRAGDEPHPADYHTRFPGDMSLVAAVGREMTESPFPAVVRSEEPHALDPPQPGRNEVGTLEQLGDYRILREVGLGGMGIVYEAEQVLLGRHVALKVLPNKALLDARARRRFEREARAAAKLHHTNIVAVFGVGEQDGLPYYVMQFIPGPGMNEVLDELIRQQTAGGATARRVSCAEASAADIVHTLLAGNARDEERGTRDEKENVCPSPLVPRPSSLALPAARKPNYWQSIAHVGMQVAAALEYAHNQGVLHRDVKPSNLLLDRQGTVWVTDFGLAKADDQDNLTHTGDLLGTLRYMPPEAFEGKADRRSDVYSLGLTLYELLALRPAFPETEGNALLRQVTTVEPARLDKLNPAIPRDLVTIVHKAMERYAAHRYASAAELAADLRRFLDDEPIRARPISSVERLWRWSRRRPATAAAVAFGLLLLATLVALPVAVAVIESDHAAELGKQKSRVEEALKQAQRHSAVLTLERALGVCEQGEVARGLLLLAQGLKVARLAEAEDLEQAFRWNLGAWARENHALLHVLTHGAEVRAVAISPDSKLIATGGADNQVRLWDAATGLPQGSSLAHPGEVQALAFHANGHLLTGCADGGARLWDVATGRQVGVTRVHSLPDANNRAKKRWPFFQGISSVAFSPDGSTFATGGYDGFVNRWDLVNGERIGIAFQIPAGITAIAFHPRGKVLLTAGLDRTWSVWDLKTGKEVSCKNTHNNVWALSIHPLGGRIATGLHQDCGARQWPLPAMVNAAVPGLAPPAKQPEAGLMRHYQPVVAVAYTPDGALLLTGSHDRTARFWDSSSAKPVGASLQHRDWVRAVAVSPDNQTAVTGSKDGTARVWRIARGSKLHTLPHVGWVRGGPAFDRETKTILTGDKLTVVRWDVATGKRTGPVFVIPPRPGDGWVTGIALSPDGKTVYAADHGRGVVHFWEAQTGKHVGVTPPHGDEVWRLALAPDGRTLITGTIGYVRGRRRGARLWDANTGRPLGLVLQHQDGVFGLAFHPNGKAVLTGGEDRTTRLWNVATGEPLGPPLVHPNAIRSVAIRHDGGAVALGSADRTAQVWDPATWKPIGPAVQHDGEVNCVAYNPQGDLLVTASSDFTARIWHVSTGKSVGPALRHARYITAISCSPDGRIAATVSDDCTAGLWSMPSPVREDPEQVWRWAQRTTGLSLGEDGAFHVLTAEDVARLGAVR